MKKVVFQTTWPPSWKDSYHYDRMEIYNDRDNPGHTYQYDTRRRHTLELLRKVAVPGSLILDVAAAQGNFSLLLAEAGYNVTWNDLRSDLIDYVKLKYESGKIAYAPGNVFELGLAGSFDVVLIAEIIEHVAHPDEFLRKIASLAKPGGYVIMTTPNGQYIRHHLPRFSECSDPSRYESMQFRPNADGHIFLLHVDEIEGLASAAGLSVLELRLFTNPLTNGHMRSAALLKVMPRSWVYAVEEATRSLPRAWQMKLLNGMAVLMRRAI